MKIHLALKENKKNILMIFKYGLNGVFRTFITVITFNIFLFNFNYIASHILSVIISTYLSSAINIRFVFLERLTRRKMIYQFLVSIFYLIVSSCLLYFAVLLGLEPKIAEIIIIGLLFLPFYFISRKALLN